VMSTFFVGWAFLPVQNPRNDLVCRFPANQSHNGSKTITRSQALNITAERDEYSVLSHTEHNSSHST
jgi:hypothetical protein